MRASLQQENPYQVKGKRFRRHNDSEAFTELSLEKGKTLVSIKCAPYYPSRDQSGERRQLRRRREQQSQEEEMEEERRERRERREREGLARAIDERERRICELEQLLRLKEEENSALAEKLGKLEGRQRESLAVQDELREQLSLVEGRHAEEAYALKQAVRRLEVEVGSLNRKWSADFDRMLREKELECRSLREKYTGLLRAKRMPSRRSSIVTHLPSSSSLSQCGSCLHSDPHRENELLDLSSFELSKEDALDS